MLTAEGPLPGLGRSNSHSSSGTGACAPGSPHLHRPTQPFAPPPPPQPRSALAAAATDAPLTPPRTPPRATPASASHRAVSGTAATSPPSRPPALQLDGHDSELDMRRASHSDARLGPESDARGPIGPASCPSQMRQRAGASLGANTLRMPSKEQQLSAISKLRQPLAVVTQKKSLIRYTDEGRRYWRWKDVVARVLHICRGASADDYSLLLQTEHWLEACDSKHRYGSNLKPYFKAWLDADTHQSFFKWLDEGDGQKVDVAERPRKRLETERVVYCGIERCFFEVNIRNGVFMYAVSKRHVNTDTSKDGPPCPPNLGAIMHRARNASAHRAPPAPAPASRASAPEAAAAAPLSPPPAAMARDEAVAAAAAVRRLSGSPAPVSAHARAPSTPAPSTQPLPGVATSSPTAAKASDVRLAAALSQQAQAPGGLAPLLEVPPDVADAVDGLQVHSDSTESPGRAVAATRSGLQSHALHDNALHTSPRLSRGLLSQQLAQCGGGASGPAAAASRGDAAAEPLGGASTTSLRGSRLHMSTSSLPRCWEHQRQFLHEGEGGDSDGAGASGGGDESESDSDDVRSLGVWDAARQRRSLRATQSCGGWRDEAGELRFRKAGVHSLPNGLHRRARGAARPERRGAEPASCGVRDLRPAMEDRDAAAPAGGASEAPTPSTRSSSAESRSSTSPDRHRRSFPSMPRLGYDDPHAYYRALRPPSRTLRFPHNSDGGTPEAAGGGVLRPSVTLRATASLAPERDFGLPPPEERMKTAQSMPVRSSARGVVEDAAADVGDAVQLRRLQSRRLYQSQLLAGHSDRGDAGGPRTRSERLRSSIDKMHCPVSHPRLASNSAIPENLKLLDLVETIAGAPPHSGHGHNHQNAGHRAAAAAATAAPAAAASTAAAPSDGYDSGASEQVMDLADRLEERMRTTGQLVKVKTQAELEVLLPRAPKVLGVGGAEACGAAAPKPAASIVPGIAIAAHSAPTPCARAEAVGALAEAGASSEAGERGDAEGGAGGSERGGAPAERGPSTAAGQLARAQDGTAALEKAREKWIYVWDMHSRLYINRKMPGRFHHSSFVAGGAVKAAGSIVVEEGVLKQLTTWSGHYRPRSSDIAMFLEWLEAKHVNMKDVELLLVKPHKQSKMNAAPEKRV